ncbi:MAG: SDR family NAD(P)-dependent oxidoreductase [Cyanobacteria bacterium P01_F01_bin.143]
MNNVEVNNSIPAIAIIGMSGKFPGAKDTTKFWENLCSGQESITTFTDEELTASGIDRESLNNPEYVKRLGILEDIDLFDAAFFGFNPKEAEVTDPQHRLFLESAWEALENAGYDPQRCESRIGVYAGSSSNDYLSLDSNRNDGGITTKIYQKGVGNANDFLATRVSYKLDLTGPSMSVQTACSTSLVATTLACQSLLNYQCDMALAGGVSINILQKTGYLYDHGGILSPDGHCRAFDAQAQGTIVGNGVGIVVLKRLEEAIEDRDHIYAVIKGSAINNDGAGKVGYTAPSVDGQAEVIAEAMALAEVDPQTISYIQAHGTGTPLGDPIEIAALSQAFRANTAKKGFCAISSVKTNIGHLDAAAGVAGLIQTALALKHQQIPPSINFEQPNPKIDFENSPFYVNTKLSKWQQTEYPRRAGVSSLGIGGTNAHVVLEEAPVRQLSVISPKGYRSAYHQSSVEQHQILILSAKTESALETATDNLVTHLNNHPELDLADVAYTLQIGRKEFDYRRIIVGKDIKDVAIALQSREPQKVITGLSQTEHSSLVFMFPGQGSQYVNMGQELYETEPVFKEWIDRCAELLEPELGLDLRSLIYPNDSELETNAEKLKQTQIAQPAIFTIEYALAQLWMSWGIKPAAAIGHSIGEYVAATIAGVFSLEDALRFVAIRGKLMQQMPTGSMLAVSLPVAEVKELLNEELVLATVNAPGLCVISGNDEAIARMQQELKDKDIESRLLHTSHAFHSPMMDGAIAPLQQELAKIKLNPPQIPFISNVTGTWITEESAINPEYWAKHMRRTVQFASGIAEILQNDQHILLEVGAGRTLSTLVKRNSTPAAGRIVLSSLRHPKETESDTAFILKMLGKLWLAGVVIDWDSLSAHQERYRVPLPTYPFERKRYWIQKSKTAVAVKTEAQSPIPSISAKQSDIGNWFYVPSWKRASLSQETKREKSLLTLVLLDECGLGEELVKRWQEEGQELIAVKLGSEFKKLSDRTYRVNPQQPEDYDLLFEELSAQDKLPQTILHLWNVTSSTNQEVADLGFYSLLFLAQALGKQQLKDQISIAVVSNNMQEVTGTEEMLCAEKATVLGPVKVIPKEYSNITCCSIDIINPLNQSWQEAKVTDQLQKELQTPFSDSVIAYRGNHRWVQEFEPVYLKPTSEKIPKLQKQGVYLITGGLGGVGLVLAEHIAKTSQAKLLLTGRSEFPAPDQWQEWLNTHDEKDRISGKIQKLQELQRLGAEILVVKADVTDKSQMRSAITQAEQNFGKFNGVIHAAGVPGGGIIQLKTQEMAAKVLAPKVQGTLVIDDIFQDAQLDFFILCSSMTAIEGDLGQVDYVSANAFLDAFAHYKTNRDGIFTVSVNWTAWQEVGMAAAAVKAASTPEELAVEHPLFEKCLRESSGEETYISQLSVIKHWVVSEHKVMGQATLPGTAYLEMARAAFQQHSKNRTLEIRDLYLIAPLVVEEGEEKEVRTILKKQGDEFEFAIIGQSSTEKDQWLEHAIGKIALSETESSQKNDMEAIAAKCNEQKLTLADQKQEYIEFGSRWNNFKQASFTNNQGFATLELPVELTQDLDLYRLHPALLDNAINFLSIRGEEVYLPFSYKKLLITEALPQKIYSHIRATNKSQDNTLQFDITIFDQEGRKLVEIEEYTLRKVEDNAIAEQTESTVSGEQNFCLQIASPGILDTLAFQETVRQKPGRSEVEIEVSATGLNFKEVLLALGMLPIPSNVTPKLGLECAGKIVSLGEEVEGFKVGDEVIVFGNGCFSKFMTTSATSVALKPQHISMEAAATIPVAFTTAYYSLIELGRLRKGERVLIHAAAGGVGTAAVQVAQWVGAEIFATAGNPEKREFLHSLGIEHVFDSRSADFAEEIKQRTQGKGVDVVLNSLAGELLIKSLDIVAPYGRFLEIGKRDILNNTKIGLEVFAKCLSFFAINIDESQPNFNQMWVDIVQHFHQKDFQPLPYKVFAVDSAANAFQYMAGAKHIGKIVVSMENQDALVIGKNKDSKIPSSFSLKETKKPISSVQRHQQKLLEQGLLSTEGVEVFNRILSNSFPQVLVSTEDFRPRVRPNLLSNSDILAKTEQDQSSTQTYSRPELNTAYIAPRNEIEQTVANLWQEILGVESIGIYDNFFELGGNSINGIQIAAKANQLGLKLTSEQFFQQQTIAELTADLSISQENQAKQDYIKKELKPTPFQQWLISQNQFDIDHAHQSLLLELTQVCDLNCLEQALQNVIQHHDVFGLRFRHQGTDWQQIAGESQEQVGLEQIDLSSLSEAEVPQAIESKTEELAASLNLFEGSLIRLALFERSQEISYLSIVIHSLAVDNVSWQIFLKDLQTAYDQISNEQIIKLPNYTGSYMQWVESLPEHAGSSEIATEQDYWVEQIQQTFTHLPVDYSTIDHQKAQAASVSVYLDKQKTKALLEEIHNAYNTEIDELLLTALVQTFATWTDDSKLRLDLRGSGREKNMTSAPMGLFTTNFPVVLELQEPSDQENSVITIKEYLRKIPRHGSSYGFLRYFSDNQAIRSQLEADPQSEVSFHYLGNCDEIIPPSSLFRLPQNCLGISYHEFKSPVYLVEITGSIIQEQLQIKWVYNQAVHRQETIELLAKNFIKRLSSLIEHCQSLEKVIHTASDFPEANLSQQNLEQFLAKLNQTK